MERTNRDDENVPDQRKKLFGFPIQVFFIIGNEFCERFCFYGMKTILSLYLKEELKFKELHAKLIYHAFVMFAYFFPVLGAMISDSWLGNFKTILYISMIYISGNILLSLSAFTFMPMRALALISLCLIAIGTGGIKPCVSAFGGDQFKLPEDSKYLEKFFGWFYFSINFGSFISTALTPMIREDVHCFGRDSCYPFAFGVPAMLMIVALVIFLLGKRLYKMKKPQGNLMIRIIGCVCYAIRNRIKYRKEPRKEHLLDYASDRYNEILINNLKYCGHVLYIYIPVPMFWALYDQQGSGWTFMATRMNGDIGFMTILPDQFQVVNPVMILGLIPLFNYCIYPLLAKKNLFTKLLQRMQLGGFLAVLSFIISAVIQMKIEAEYPVLPSAGEAQLRWYNSLPCNVIVEGDAFINLDPSLTTALIPNLTVYKIDIKIKGQSTFKYKATIEGECSYVSGSIDFDFTVAEKDTTGHHLTMDADKKLSIVAFKDDIEKHVDGLPKVRNFISSVKVSKIEYELSSLKVESVTSSTDFIKDMKPGVYQVKIDDKSVGEIKLEQGGVYALMSYVDMDEPVYSVYEITPPNGVHMLWLMPQYIIITVAEILFSISCIEFAYSQAPTNMKSLMQSASLLTSSVGNLLVLVIEQLGNFAIQSVMFFVWAALMLLDVLLFTYMSWNYKYVEKQISMEDILAAEARDKM